MIKLLEWNGLKEGDAVQILGPSGKALPGSFHFKAYCDNEKGDCWVDVFGGSNRQKSLHRWRSVTPDRIRPDRRKKAARGRSNNEVRQDRDPVADPLG